MRKKRHILLTSGMLLALCSITAVFLLSACGTPVYAVPLGGQPPTTDATATTAPPAQNDLIALLPLLQKSVQSFQQIQFVHIDIKGQSSIQISKNLLPAGAQNINATTKAQSDISIKTQQEKGNITATFVPTSGQGKTTIKASEIISDQKLYLRTGTPKKWQIIDLIQLAHQAQSTIIGISNMQQLLAEATQHITIVDQGVNTREKQHLRHLAITTDQQALRALITMLPESTVKQALSNVHLLSPLHADLFLDDTTSLPQHIVLNGKAQVNLGTILPGANMATTTFTVTITLNKYNKPVQIQVPTQQNMIVR